MPDGQAKDRHTGFALRRPFTTAATAIVGALLEADLLRMEREE